MSRAVDELALLVRGFNQMTQELESSSRELDLRRRFTEAILESIPTGVHVDRRRRLASSASTARCRKIFPPEAVARAPRAWKTSSPARTRPSSSTS